MRAQKKIMGRMTNKNFAKMFIDDVSANLLDDVHRFIKSNASTKKESDKVVKNIIKLIVKLCLLDKNDMFDETDQIRIDNFKRQFRSVAMTLVSFHNVAYSYERNFLIRSTNKCRDILNEIVVKHLSHKSFQRSELIFEFFLQPTILDRLFSPDDNSVIELRSRIINGIERLLDGDR